MSNACAWCGAPQGTIVIPSDELVYTCCLNCYARLGTCAGCTHCTGCDFETNPSPLPKQIQHTMQQGNMTMQTVIKNPERVKLTCFNCFCFDEEALQCKRELGWCSAHQEVTPYSRTNDENPSSPSF